MMIKLFIFAQLKGLKNLERISDHVTHKKTVQRQVGLKSISKSQLSRKLRDIPSNFTYSVLQSQILKVKQIMGQTKVSKALVEIHLIDSSTISMCLQQYE